MDDEKKELPELLSMKYVTQRLQVHPNTLRQWEKKGVVTVYRVGIRGDRRFLKTDIMRLCHLDYEQAFREELAQWRIDKALEVQRRGNESVFLVNLKMEERRKI